MTRLFVISDSHDSIGMLEFAAQMINAGAYTHIIHLGDMRRDAEWLEKRINRQVISVRGNCDYFSGDAREIVISAEKVRILITHGDKYGVKSSYDALSYRGEELGCALALFGHTHVPFSGYVGGLLLVNPGALMGGKCAEIEIEGEIMRPKLGRV